ncbi:unnamed protein product [Auanema sp. JU1783]|nr:unnamed protein product [Auanema sp. JU1783]
MIYSKIILFLGFCLPIFCLNQNERNDLSRKFKYYFPSVRPSAPDNFISGQNGTFFNIQTELHLLLANPKASTVVVDILISLTWIDDRLVLRELPDRLELPIEFQPWTPRVQTFPSSHSQSVFLTPNTGSLTWYQRIKSEVSCESAAWKRPFHDYKCEIIIENIGNEVLTIERLRDFRQDSLSSKVTAHLDRFPLTNLVLKFSGEWQSSLLSVFLPSILVIFLVFFAQWKRRKVQVLVSTASLVCLLVMLTGNRDKNGATLLDLWLSGCFLHSVFLLAIDLILPARRVRYSLIVPIERSQPRGPVQIIAKTERESSGLQSTLEKLVEKTFGRIREPTSTKTELVTACPGETPIQRQVTSATLGERKRLALLAVASSFLAFMLIYLLLVLSID